jgi:D-3-phosphoglycerate dehydrogenase
MTRRKVALIGLDGQIVPHWVPASLAREGIDLVIDEAALAKALTDGWIAGAGLDVLEQEPPDRTSPLLRLDNVVITPHIAAYSDRYLEYSWHLSVDTVLALSRGCYPPSCVNRPENPRWELR